MMFIFQLTTFGEQPTHKPKHMTIHITEKLVKDKLNKKRWRCPESAVKEIMKSNNPGKKLNELIASLRTIAKAAGNGAGEAFEALTNDKIAELFVKNPKSVIAAFGGIAKAAGKGVYGAFLALKNDKIAELFVKNPKMVIAAFGGIAKAIGNGANMAFLALKNDKIAELFVKNPNAFVEIAKAAGKLAGWAFEALKNDKIAELFVKNPKSVIAAFGGIAKAIGNEAYWAFEALKNDKIAELFVKNPKSVIAAFGGIAKAAGKGVYGAFLALKNDKIAELFVKNPKSVIAAFGGIAKAIGKGANMAFEVLKNDKIAGLFVKNPNAFVEIAKAIGNEAYWAFNALKNDKIAGLFVKNPQSVIAAFGEIAKTTGTRANEAFDALTNDKIAELFVNYLHSGKKMDFDKMMIMIISNTAGIEIGRPLDDLHNNQKKRMEYLNSLSTMQVLGLLLTDPEYFYTSTNHLLFDRLKKDLSNSNITKLLEKYGVKGTEEHRNLILRAVNYDRFCGSANCLFNYDEMDASIRVMLEPLNSGKVDAKYYYLMANLADEIKSEKRVADIIIDSVRKKLTEFYSFSKPTKEQKMIARALGYLLYQLKPNDRLITHDQKIKIERILEKRYFEPKNYKVNGKLMIVQVFDKKDTQNDHWVLSNRWFEKKYGKPKVEGNKYVYDGKNTTVILYMGDKDQDNQQFIRDTIEKTPNLILTFRGHSYSLKNSFPSGIFKNKPGHVLFIPGSCGSAGSVPEYMAQNPKTDLRFFSNTSTGRGQVTNAILDALIDAAASGKRMPFSEILKTNEKRIIGSGGDPKTIKVFSEGEGLVTYMMIE